ncbi:MAG: hypothetical protein A3B74_02650 [Candidatus Kerfeldbacteria bacterium RIFCSPHIGHO2_02_FULL_42_14]|uniref:Uncharacterized protein n=1 Tax=Candidatus Kerfeldbacteria bacterium RIFCSPHIGHO2_02_FULL_42_14 TaxID=1798540 RepID=A0A1G2ARW7_9BACT|nr:MAG: hypothetical protein A3B74_02650 [Candidatus Kerfeldbacteria bacterium RIFCSPHIGHO2_02_FULL_42_14]OGY80440.1 MAG: hypothetical protein A3E60_05270 [Candidatus Kerfeldbacteria bacterium RIFCSPHIGHO2_12_FULL_42_13]OGY83870.1 MAG: hypothetical protein A3I91_04795 [Candidatus Kerfeldbacteria bacterium RIFCSPLOWO2_02_FULL_42_19]OGY86591.1 MAG: hypothetical protein A3G01_05035 [Candidatus Kerfeldbacteria bacterium RIFCSPLOWO2_12_FULL_43_9]
MDLVTRQSATWILDIVQGASLDSTKNTVQPAEGAKVTVRIESPNNTQILVDTVGVDGARWITSFPEVNTYMYIQNIEGAFPWAPEDKVFWADRSVLSYTGEETLQ